MRVLVVSDNEMERLRATTAMRSSADIEIVECTSPKQAQKLVEVGDIDVLVVDGDIAPKGGYSFLYEVRAWGELHGRSTPPALVLAAREQDRFIATWSGANEIVFKPVDPFAVARIVAGLVGAEPAVSDPTFDAPVEVKRRLGIA